jgi:DNA-binding CsgD family transcriptional regulator
MSKYKDDIIRLRKQGKSYREIENELDCSKGTIAYHCKQEGLKDIGYKQQKITDEKIKKINEFRLDGKTIEEISNRLDVSKSSVQKYTSEDTKEKLQQNRIKTGSEKRKSLDRKEFVGSKFYKGVVAEEKVKTRLIKLGHKIYDPVIRSVEDLVVETKDEFKKVQVKHAAYRNGCVIARLSRSCNTYKRSDKKAKCYHKDDVDIFAIYCSEIDEIYGIDFADAPNHKVKLRVDPPKKLKGNIRWAKDYDIEKVL